jgi:hypothetical protein
MEGVEEKSNSLDAVVVVADADVTSRLVSDSSPDP